MKTKEAIIGKVPAVLDYFGLPPVTGKRHFKGECPICKKTGAFRIDDREGRGTWICRCGSGDIWKLLTITQEGKSIRDLYDEVDRLLGNAYQKPEGETQDQQPDSVAKLRARVSRKFSTLPSLRGTTAETYLQRRGINCLPDDFVGFCESQPYRGKTYQAMFALATDDRGALCYLHRTLLDGDKKADIGQASRKMMRMQEDGYLDHAGSVAIRMFPPSSTMGIAEGIETALSCRQVYQCNVWSTINAGFMKKFIAPKGVKRLIIFTDYDISSATGHAAAMECARANLLSKNDVEEVLVRWPDAGDFNDLLINGDVVRELKFKRAA